MSERARDIEDMRNPKVFALAVKTEEKKKKKKKQIRMNGHSEADMPDESEKRRDEISSLHCCTPHPANRPILMAVVSL